MGFAGRRDDFDLVSHAAAAVDDCRAPAVGLLCLVAARASARAVVGIGGPARVMRHGVIERFFGTPMYEHLYRGITTAADSADVEAPPIPVDLQHIPQAFGDRTPESASGPVNALGPLVCSLYSQVTPSDFA